jgi:hypothetical protein
VIALGEQAGTALDTAPSRDDAPPEHEIERAGEGPRPTKDRYYTYRYLQLPEPITNTSGSRKWSRITFTIHREPEVMDAPVRRGIYCAVIGTPIAEYSQYLLVDGLKRDLAYIHPVLMHEFGQEFGVPDPDTWRDVKARSEAILQEFDPTYNGEPVEYLGFIPSPGLPAETLIARDPLTFTNRLPIPAPTHENVVRHARFAPGLHIAPFRGPNGELLIVAIAQDGGLDAMWPVTGIDTWRLWVEPTKLPSDLHRTVEYTGHVDSHRDAVVDDRLLASDPTLFYKYTDQVLPRRDVVHVCPWFGRVDRTARMIAVTDIFLRAQEFQEFGGFAAQAHGVQSALTFLRDIREDHIADPKGTKDPISYHPDFTPEAKQQYRDSVDRDELVATEFARGVEARRAGNGVTFG